MGSRRIPLEYLALAAVCFFWGTTYLGIRMALESFAPLQLVAARFLISGTILLAWAKWQGHKLPPANELLRTALFGILMLGVANGCLTFAETWIPSSLAALLLTTAPFWLVGLESLMPGGDRITLPVVTGLFIGLAGVVLLVWPETGVPYSPTLLKGFIVLQIGSFFWNAVSIAQRRWKATTHPILNGAIQQTAAGLVYLVWAALTPQKPIHLTPTGLAGIIWLVTFGSIVGYSAYIYALETLPVSLVSIYTYINPVVAVALGWAFYREPFGVKESLAMLVIFAGVFVVKSRTAGLPWGRSQSTSAPSPLQPEPLPQSSTK